MPQDQKDKYAPPVVTVYADGQRIDGRLAEAAVSEEEYRRRHLTTLDEYVAMVVAANPALAASAKIYLYGRGVPFTDPLQASPESEAARFEVDLLAAMEAVVLTTPQFDPRETGQALLASLVTGEKETTRSPDSFEPLSAQVAQEIVAADNARISAARPKCREASLSANTCTVIVTCPPPRHW